MSLEPPIPRSESRHAIHYTIVESVKWPLISYYVLMLSYLSLLVACKVSFDIASAWILILLPPLIMLPSSHIAISIPWS